MAESFRVGMGDVSRDLLYVVVVSALVIDVGDRLR